MRVAWTAVSEDIPYVCFSFARSLEVISTLHFDTRACARAARRNFQPSLNPGLFGQRRGDWSMKNCLNTVFTSKKPTLSHSEERQNTLSTISCQHPNNTFYKGKEEQKLFLARLENLHGVEGRTLHLAGPAFLRRIILGCGNTSSKNCKRGKNPRFYLRTRKGCPFSWWLPASCEVDISTSVGRSGVRTRHTASFV